MEATFLTELLSFRRDLTYTPAAACWYTFSDSSAPEPTCSACRPSRSIPVRPRGRANVDVRKQDGGCRSRDLGTIERAEAEHESDDETGPVPSPRG